MSLKKLLSIFLVFILMSTFSLNVCFISLNTYAIGNEEIIEQKTDNNASGIWEQAEKDGCKDGFFHYAVEEYLIDPQNNYGYKRELPIQYNTINLWKIL